MAATYNDGLHKWFGYNSGGLSYTMYRVKIVSSKSIFLCIKILFESILKIQDKDTILYLEDKDSVEDLLARCTPVTPLNYADSSPSLRQLTTNRIYRRYTSH